MYTCADKACGKVFDHQPKAIEVGNNAMCSFDCWYAWQRYRDYVYPTPGLQLVQSTHRGNNIKKR